MHAASGCVEAWSLLKSLSNQFQAHKNMTGPCLQWLHGRNEYVSQLPVLDRERCLGADLSFYSQELMLSFGSKLTRFLPWMCWDEDPNRD
jgi:pyruvate-formate lyase